MLDGIELGEKEKDWGDRVGVSVTVWVGFFFTICFLIFVEKIVNLVCDIFNLQIILSLPSFNVFFLAIQHENINQIYHTHINLTTKANLDLDRIITN